MLVSVVIPVKNEAKNVPLLTDMLIKVFDGIKTRYELIFIEDGSTDATYDVLMKLAKRNRSVKVIRFQGNFGKAAGLTAGFKKARGDYIVTMDGDLQDDPNEIPRFLKAIEKYDLVSGWKYKRKDPLGKTIPSRFFNILTSMITGIRLHDFNCGYKIYRKEVAKSVHIYGELHRYIPALAHWQGFSIGEMKVKHHKRRFGKSKYGVSRLLKGFFDLITVRFITKFSKRPMHFFGLVGFACIFIGFISGVYLFYQWLNSIKIGDRPLLILTVLLMVLGVQFISIGLIGEMIVSNSSKEEYIVREELN
jgi:glycosyltransferase involved in cell wall biosynthesis